MKVLDLTLLALESIRERKVRNALNTLGILIGIAALVALLSIGEGVNVAIGKEVIKMGSTVVSVLPSRASEGFKLTMDDVKRISKIKGVECVTPYIALNAKVVSGEEEPIPIRIVAIEPRAFLEIIAVGPAQGRFLRAREVGTLVFGNKSVKPPGVKKPIAKVGDRVLVEAVVLKGGRPSTERYSLLVVGVLEEYGGIASSTIDDCVFVTVETACKLFRTGKDVTAIVLKAKSPELVDEIIDRIYEEYGDNVIILSVKQALEAAKTIMGTLTLFLGGIAGISLLVAGLGILNTMLITVLERTREIGVLKAIGAKNHDILLMFLIEALILGTMGGLAGLLFGFAAAYLFGHLGFIFGFKITPSISPWLMGAGLLFAVVVSVLSGLYPAYKAAQLDPVEALRYE